MATSTMEVDVIAPTEHDMLSVDNMPTPQVLSKYRLAGHFCSTAIKAVIQQCVQGANTAQLCQFGDEAILAQTMTVFQSTERGIAEPTSINANNCVRGYTPLPDDQGYVLVEGDVVTVAMGVHIDGYAVHSSQTIHVKSAPSPASGPVADAVCALHYAVRGIINELSTGSTGQIHDVLREAVDTFGVSIVQGSQLRRVRRFLVGQSTIEELDEKAMELSLPASNEELSVVPGEVYLLDLAISTASGMVKEHSELRPTIYTRSIPRSNAHTNFKLAATRALFTEITSNTSLYSVFPFTFRNHINPSRAKLGLAELQAHGVLSPSLVVVEKSPKAIVVRRTVTVLVKKVDEVLILGGGEGESKVMWVKSEKSLRPGGIVEQALTREGVKIVELKRVEGEKMDLE